VAPEYAARIAGELAHKPLDRQLLDQLIERVQSLGPICDMGCGPGHIAGYLHGQGASVCGIDLSAGMIVQARTLHPDIEFRQGNMLALDVADETWGGIAAFYSLIHIPRASLRAVLHELQRTLKPGGSLLVAFHIGDDVVHLEEWWGETVNVDFLYFQPDEMKAHLADSGFVVDEITVRPPYETVEHPSHRAYIFARKP
jgi:SAM-dependent methyltransferase